LIRNATWVYTAARSQSLPARKCPPRAAQGAGL
jgi:hypothetical protein